jgi:hypothetical protein
MGFNSRMRHDRGSVLLRVLEATGRSNEYYYRRLLLQLALVLALLAVKAHCSRPEVRAGGGAAAAAGRAKYVESTFRRHFWSTADADHYKLSEDGEEAELVLDRVAGFCSSLPASPSVLTTIQISQQANARHQLCLQRQSSVFHLRLVLLDSIIMQPILSQP